MYGKATGPDLDLDDQIIDPEFLTQAMPAWFDSYANVRQQHSSSLAPAGKGIKLEQEGDDWYLTAKIVDTNAVKLVRSGVYSAFSVGIARPRIVRDAKARGGRITGGEIVEVSIVDRPANPTCKFMTATKGAGYIGKAVDLALAAAHPESVVYRRDYNDFERADYARKGVAMADGSLVIDDKQDLADAVAAFVDFRLADSDAAALHIMRRAKAIDGRVPRAIEKAAKNAGRKARKGIPVASGLADPESADDEKLCSHSYVEGTCEKCGMAADADTYKADGPADGEAECEHEYAAGKCSKCGKAETAEKVAPTYAEKRIHDVFCAAYKLDDVLDAYPTLIGKNGVAGSLGALARQTTWAMLSQEINEDGGSGRECWDIYTLADAYKDLCSFLSMELMASDMAVESVMVSARAELSKMFDKANGGFLLGGGSNRPIPGATEGAVTPGSFRRPYLSAGHTPPTSSGTAPRIPGEKPITSWDFTRGPLEAGHQDPSPGDAPGQEHEVRPHRTVGKRLKKSQAAALRKSARAAITVIHDAITAVHPELCVMGHETPQAGTSSATKSRKATKASAKKGRTKMSKATKGEAIDAKPMDTGSGNKPKPIALGDGPKAPTNTKKKGKGMKARKALSPELALRQFAKKQRAEARKAAKKNARAIAKANAVLGPVMQAVTAVQQTVEKMASQPDPARSPMRGVMPGMAEKRIAEPEIAKGVGDGPDPERVAFLQRIAAARGPESANAQQELEALGITE